MNQRADLIVVGGGPAGSTLATLAKKYAAQRRVILLEKSPGPRHHVGESLLPGLVPVLKELGVFEAIDGAGFPKKIGANYIWGRDRRVWENDFNEVNIEAMIRRHGDIPPRIEYAWQVRRSLYDEILLGHAQRCGVEVLRGASARAILEKGSAVGGVVLDDGRRFEAELTADCSGQSGFLSRFRRVRQYNEALKNVAVYAYFRGARWKYAYSGHPDKTKIFVCSVSAGWFWYIPIAEDVVSVGLVIPVSLVKDAPEKDLHALYDRELRKCVEIAPLLEGACRIEDFEGTGKSLFTQSDWSYLSAAASGQGWLAAGDAAVFVDPILSTGVTLAHLCAHRAAYTILESWSAQGRGAGDLLWRDYDRYCREAAAQYLALALFWYGNDVNAENWWRRASLLQRAALPLPLSDKSAFVTVSAGLTQYYDRLFSSEGMFEENVTRLADYPLYGALFEESGSDAEAPAPGCRPRLLYPYVSEIAYLPVAGKGRLRPARRLRFSKHDASDPLSDAFNPRRMVTRHHLELLRRIDGRATLAQIEAALESEGVPSWWLRRFGRPFLQELAAQGVLEAASAAEVP